MVKTLMLMVLLLSGAVDAAPLTAQLDKTTATLGEPVSLTIQASGLSLDALDLTPLTAQFEVFARTLSRGAGSETLVLTLYPRVSGVLHLPALQLHALQTVALPLKVEEGSDTVPRVTASWTLEPPVPRVSQPTRLSLAICDDGSLQWQRPLLPTASGRVLRPLGEDEGEGARGCTLHRYFWALNATQDGVASLAVPMLDAGRFGQRLRFPGPDLSYRAIALPAWLPANVPPVAPRVQADSLPARWPLQRPLAWRFHVTGAYTTAGLKALLAIQLRDTPELGVYPPLIEDMALDDPASPLSRYAVTLFFQPRATGQLRVPTLRLPWYDVARGQLASTVVEGRTLTVFDPRWRFAAQAAGAGMGLLLLAGLFWQIRYMARWRLARRRGLCAIRQARDAAELALAVRQFSLLEQSTAPSLGAWQRRLRQEAETCDAVMAVRQLEQYLFGQTSLTLSDLKQVLLSALAQARPKWPFQRMLIRH
jgi:hypothetical protein